jgi:chromosome segregation ATPase
MMTTENILEQIRDGQAQEEGLKKRFGGYRTKEVDQYVEKLLNRLHNMETVYQERCEEMRTHLRGVTREREELAERTRELEKQLADLPKRVDAYLAEQGLVALPKKEYEQLRSAGAELKTEVACLGEEKERLIAEQKRILKELEEAQASQRIDEQTLDELERYKAEASELSEKCRRLGTELAEQAEALCGLQARLEESEALGREQAEEIGQERARYRMLELQYQLAQKMTNELIEEKERQEKEALRRQERAETERKSLINRYRCILKSQQHCMERLHESFVASVRCMESLSEAGIMADPAEETARSAG